MKKILALALVLTMMLSMFNLSFVASAADATPEGTALYSEEDLTSLLERNGKYYLANDIDLSGAATIELPAGITIDGNGFGFIKTNGVVDLPLFSFEKMTEDQAVIDPDTGAPVEDPVTGEVVMETVTVPYTTPTTFQNLYFGRKGAFIKLATTDIYHDSYSMTAPLFTDPSSSVAIDWTNVDFSLSKGQENSVGYVNTLFWNMKGTQNFTNCDLTISVSKAGGEIGAYALNTTGTITMTNCTANGAINTSSTAGGFFKEISSGSVTMTNCTNNIPITAGGIAGGFFSSIRGDLFMYDCKNTANLTLGAHAGSLAGNTQKAGKLYVDGFVNEGTVSGTAHLGGIFGAIWSTKVDGHLNTFKNIINNGAVTATGNGGYTGGIVGDNGQTAFLMENVINNGDVSGNTRHMGGFIGRNATDNGTLEFLNGAQVFRNCTNNGDVVNSNTGDYGLAGFVAHPQSQVRLVFENCVNNGNVGSEGTKANYRTAGGFMGTTDHKYIFPGDYAYVFINCENNGTMIGGTNNANACAGGFIAYSQTAALFENCVNTGDIIGNKAQGTGGLIGKTSWRANASAVYEGTADKLTELGQTAGLGIKAVNCINTGNISSTVSVPNGGLFGIIDSAVTVVIDNCANYGTVSGGNDAGAMIANHGGGVLTISNCANYGAISGSQIVGGIAGWTKGTTEITNVANYADVKGCHGVGGIVGEVVVGTVENALNAGNVGPFSGNAEGIGGILGIFRTVTNNVVLKDVANIGTVTGTTKANTSYGCFAEGVGQFIGRVGGGSNGNDPWIADSGIVDGVYGYDNGDAIAPDSIKLINALGYGVAQINPDAQWAPSEVTFTPSVVDGKLAVAYVMLDGGDANDVKPELRNNGAFGDNVKVAASSTYDLNADIAKLEAMGFKANFKIVDGRIVVDNAPSIKGYQVSKDGTAIRFAATTDDASAEAVGFAFTLTYNGVEIANTTANAESLLYSVKANGLDTELAANYGGKYFSTITFENVPAAGTLKITVQATVDGVATGTVATVTFVDGVIAK